MLYLLFSIFGVLLYTLMVLVVLYFVCFYNPLIAFGLLVLNLYAPFFTSLYLVYQKEREAPRDATHKSRVICVLAMNITIALVLYLPVLYVRVYRDYVWNDLYKNLFIIYQIAVSVDIIISGVLLLIEMFILDLLDRWMDSKHITYSDYGTLTV